MRVAFSESPGTVSVGQDGLLLGLNGAGGEADRVGSLGDGLGEGFHCGEGEVLLKRRVEKEYDGRLAPAKRRPSRRSKPSREAVGQTVRAIRASQDREVFADGGNGVAGAFDEDGAGGSPAQGLQPHGARAGEEVKEKATLHRAAQNVEEGLAQAGRGGAGGESFRCFEFAAFELSGGDPNHVVLPRFQARFT